MAGGDEGGLGALVAPATTALLTMELQRGVVGAEAALPMLAEAVAATGLLEVAGRLCASARAVGVRVVHCTAVNRPDGAGGVANNRILALNERARRRTGRTPLDLGSAGVELMDELGAEVGPSGRDIEVPRLHGLTPFTSTSLDQILRNLGVRTVVAIGVSLNVGILGLALSAADLGYQVVVVRDAVCGIPADYADAVLANTLANVATVVSSSDLLAAWDSAS